MTKELMSFFSTPQYSITPVLQGRDFKELLTTFKSPLIERRSDLVNKII